MSLKRTGLLLVVALLVPSFNPAASQDSALKPMALPAEEKPGPADSENGVDTQTITGAVDPASVDTETITGAVMTERDMLQYCVNIADSARETRYALIEQMLDAKQAEIDEKLDSLREKMDAIRAYVEVRERFRTAAEEQVVAIFETMRPDAAAGQLAEMETGMSASIIMKLDPKVSSKILTEMQPRQAAMIANFLTAAMKTPKKGQPTQ